MATLSCSKKASNGFSIGGDVSLPSGPKNLLCLCVFFQRSASGADQIWHHPSPGHSDHWTENSSILIPKHQNLHMQKSYSVLKIEPIWLFRLFLFIYHILAGLPVKNLWLPKYDKRYNHINITIIPDRTIKMNDRNWLYSFDRIYGIIAVERSFLLSNSWSTAYGIYCNLLFYVAHMEFLNERENMLKSYPFCNLLCCFFMASFLPFWRMHWYSSSDLYLACALRRPFPPTSWTSCATSWCCLA